MNIYEIVDNVATLYNNKDSRGYSRPILLIGPPGCAKTSIIKGPLARALARITGKLVDVIIDIPSTREAPDYRGFPIPVKGEPGCPPVIRYPVPDLLDRIQRSPAFEDGIIILAFDELLQADASTQKVLCSPLLDYSLGEHQMPNNVWIIAASNRQADGAGVNRALSILTNRLCRYEVELPVGDWLRYARDEGYHPLGMAFAERFPTHFATATPPRDGAFCTFRSFSVALDAISAYNRVKGLEPHVVPDNVFLRNTVYGLIGEAVGLEFFAFSNVAELLPSRQEILETPHLARLPGPGQVDVQYAAMNMAISLALEDPCNLNPCMKYIIRMPMRELAVKAMVDLGRSAGGGVLMNNPEASAWLAQHKALVCDANAVRTSY